MTYIKKDKTAKKELTVSEFQAITYLEFTFSFHLAPIFDTPDEGEEDAIGEEFKEELLDIYTLITQAVTLKDGSRERELWKKPVSECEIALPLHIIKEIIEKLDGFIDKANKDRDSYNELENELIDHLDNDAIETIRDTLVYAYIEPTNVASE